MPADFIEPGPEPALPCPGPINHIRTISLKLLYRDQPPPVLPVMAPGIILESSPTPVIINTNNMNTNNSSSSSTKASSANNNHAHGFPESADCEEYARSLDESDPLHGFRDKFIIPSKAGLKRKSLATTTPGQCSVHISGCCFDLVRAERQSEKPPNGCGGPPGGISSTPTLPFPCLPFPAHAHIACLKSQN